jgi:hypothetical protein
MAEFLEWKDTSKLGSRKFTCGYCGSLVSSDVGYYGSGKASAKGPLFISSSIYVCPGCTAPTYFWNILGEESVQTPAEPLGRPVEALPDGVKDIYAEARLAASSKAFTGCVLLCRTLLTHVAEEKGANVKGTFQEHIEHLISCGALPAHSKAWVDQIRQHGNRATHQLELATPTMALEMLTFSEMVLKLIYEFPSKLPQPPKAEAPKPGK